MHDKIDQDKAAQDGAGCLKAETVESALGGGCQPTPVAKPCTVLLDSVDSGLIDPAYDVRKVRAGMTTVHIPADCEFDVVELSARL